MLEKHREQKNYRRRQYLVKETRFLVEIFQKPPQNAFMACLTLNFACRVV